MIKIKKVIILFFLSLGILGSFFTSVNIVSGQPFNPNEDEFRTRNPDGGGGVNRPPIDGVNRPPIDGVTSRESFNLRNPFAFQTVQQLVDKLLDIIIKVGGVLAFFFIIYAGFLFVTAAGNEDKVNKAKATFLWVIVGVSIVLGAKVISILLQGTVSNIITG